MKVLDVILVGAGSRGRIYTDHMTGDNFRVVAVAEPIKQQRDYIQKLHKIPDEMCFDSWDQMLEKEKFADVCIIATSDSLHYKPAMKAIEKGYNLLLEKPIAPTYRECRDIASAAKKQGVKILVCHVLRYTPFFRKIKDLINENKLGKVISVHHSECVGNVHQSHSYVRGNWGNEEKSSCMLLAKSCHDIDILQWLIDSKCKSVSSFGSLSYFKKENAPDGAPDYCIDGCPYGEECYYNAIKLYLEDEENDWFRNAAAKKVNPTNAEIEEVLRTTQYGKCVFKCDNDVVDHQVVNLEYENGAVASFNMSAFNKGGRYIRVMGTDGELYGDMEENTIDYYSFKTREHTIINPLESKLSGDITGGHGGGDAGIVSTLYKYIVEDYSGDMLSEIGVSAENHATTFAAEKARVEHRVISLSEFENECDCTAGNNAKK
ncbi:MAG: Gfo/Idh/MocA family oxidoreductase [Ruminococcaceae bacterium]|nr:Gfo/Idh/MocA family oxidoreductase [Oscillospiraceae bacterium]